MATHEVTPYDPRLVQYILGLLPEEDTERFDEASVADDEIAAALASVEDDLVDAYATGTLDQERRQQFETHYLKSPRRREKVKFARRFLAVVDRASAPSSLAPVTAGHSGRIAHMKIPTAVAPTSRRRPRIRWSFVATAASVTLAAGVFLNDLGLRQGLRQLEHDKAVQSARAEALGQQLADTRSHSGPTPAAIAPLLSEPANRSAAPPAESTSVLAPQVIVLFPQTRSLGQTPTVAISTGRTVAFELRLESDDFPHYRTALRDVANSRVVWRSNLLTNVSSTASLSVAVPSGVLTVQHYSFELTGVDKSGHEAAIGSYAVVIERR